VQKRAIKTLALVFGFASVALTAADAQVNRFSLLVGRWVNTSPVPGQTTPSGYQIIIAPDGSVFSSNGSLRGAAGRCIDAGANFCFEGVTDLRETYRCAYDVTFFPGNQQVNFSLLRRTANDPPCPVGIFNRAL
jgi:hypothetical protein